MWTVYQRPRDYPAQFVARLWKIGPGTFQSTDEILLAETLAEIRAMLPPGLMCLQRLTDDDPCIVEVWL